MLIVSIFPDQVLKKMEESMFQSKTLGKKSFVLVAIGVFTFLVANASNARAAESGCVTCHLDKAMLQKNITPEKGAKSALQSGAG